jgi:hypothetical protein
MPVVVALFLAMAAAEDTSPPTLVHEDVQMAVRERPLVIEAKISDESGIFDPVVLWRVGSDGPFARAPLEDAGNGVYRAKLPKEILVADIEYFIEAYDGLGNGPARHGTADLPVHVRLVTAAELPPSTTPAAVVTPEATAEAEESSTLLYVGLGVGGAALLVVVAAAAVTAGVVVFLLMQPTTPPGDGKVTLTVEAPVPVTGALSTSMLTGSGRGGP